MDQRRAGNFNVTLLETSKSVNGSGGGGGDDHGLGTIFMFLSSTVSRNSSKTFLTWLLE